MSPPTANRPPSMPPLRILILSDGRPGHFNLSEGIAAAMARRREALIERRDVRRGRWSGAALAALTRSRLPAGGMLSSVYGLVDADLPASDVIVSAGAETLAANVWLARARRVPNVFYGSLRLFNPHDFALILTSYQRHATRPNHCVTLKPSAVDPDSLSPPPPVKPGEIGQLAMLVGGDSGTIQFSARDWDHLAHLIETTAAAGGVSWRVANSRRTPDPVSDRLAQLAAPGGPITQFLDVRTAGPGTLLPLLAQCHAALCTADSSSMLSECIWNRKPTISLLPEQFVLPADESQYRNWLSSKGWTRAIPLDQSTPLMLNRTLKGILPLSTNPQSDLSELLAQRLPSLGL